MTLLLYIGFFCANVFCQLLFCLSAPFLSVSCFVHDLSAVHCFLLPCSCPVVSVFEITTLVCWACKFHSISQSGDSSHCVDKHAISLHSLEWTACQCVKVISLESVFSFESVYAALKTQCVGYLSCYICNIMNRTVKHSVVCLL